jgi:hypothetical protein
VRSVVLVAARCSRLASLAEAFRHERHPSELVSDSKNAFRLQILPFLFKKCARTCPEVTAIHSNPARKPAVKGENVAKQRHAGDGLFASWSCAAVELEYGFVAGRDVQHNLARCTKRTLMCRNVSS